MQRGKSKPGCEGLQEREPTQKPRSEPRNWPPFPDFHQFLEIPDTNPSNMATGTREGKIHSMREGGEKDNNKPKPSPRSSSSIRPQSEPARFCAFNYGTPERRIAPWAAPSPAPGRETSPVSRLHRYLLLQEGYNY